MPPILILTRLQTGFVAGDPELNASSPTHSSVHLIMPVPSIPRCDALFTLGQVIDSDDLDFQKEEKHWCRGRVAMCRSKFLISQITDLERTLIIQCGLRNSDASLVLQINLQDCSRINNNFSCISLNFHHKEKCFKNKKSASTNFCGMGFSCCDLRKLVVLLELNGLIRNNKVGTAKFSADP
jgi:hypothetical protein